ncbi:uncharacterized protein GGS25DRAFT_528968 [Hypoxylon fragiforme]|uniref:uncharacterized protein n=1 Tax=Hypoxylon fragiforme TaxID=63214 RepID=UPI0020C6D48C|nr:uncharacterized protein GGS25DRAFT_528968 [Hypoxylon fragiforme]KAI2612281.1 hypothetical protein GGS25DRAFT_528968 [Hypoxylon fragiforme]
MSPRIPSTLVSLETIEYLGFTHPTAVELWDTWTFITMYKTEGLTANPTEYQKLMLSFFIKFIVDHLIQFEDTKTDDDDDWIQCMEKCGICKDLQDTIMDPFFRDTRRMATCHTRLTEIIKLNFAALQKTLSL